MNILVLVGRMLFSAIFIMSGFSHFTHDVIQEGANHGVLFPHLLVPFSGAMSLLGGISIMIGYKARVGAWLIILFLIPVTAMMHAFWNVTDPQAAMMQQIAFMKNLSMLGGAFLIAYFGSGPLSFDYQSPKIYSFRNHH